MPSAASVSEQPLNHRHHSDSDISAAGRYVVLIVAFLGWLFAGFQLAITSQAMRSAAIDVLSNTGQIDPVRYETINAVLQKSGRNADPKKVLSGEDASAITGWRAKVNQWFAWYQCALMFGAAAGGLIFGRLGDSLGRSRALALSILCYSIFSGLTYWCRTPEQLLLLRFLACLGVGGTWPNGVALVSEVWVTMSRPLVAGVIGTAANIGIFAFATLTTQDSFAIQPSTWRWVMELGAWPAVLGAYALFFVPESPVWLKRRLETGHVKSDAVAVSTDQVADTPQSSVFGKRYVKTTLLGIMLATIPLIGGWGSANWMVPWAGQAGETAQPPRPKLEAQVGQARAFAGILGSLMGGWIAGCLGRRRTYFLASLIALACAQFTFWALVPTDPTFLAWVAALGFFSGIYFGWLPLCLPEMFPVRIRSTGSGVSFNFGRVLTGVTLIATGALQTWFQGDFAKIGRVTSLIFALGMLISWWISDSRKEQLED